MRQASDSELELMKVIWDNGGSALYTQITALLAEKGIFWTKNTIITLLSRLIEKKLLKTSKIGHRNQYIVLVSAEEYQGIQTASFLDKIYEGNAKGLVTTLIQKELLSAKDYEELKKFWQGGGMDE